MSKQSKLNLIRPRPILSNCRYKYCDFVEPVYEMDRVLKKDIEMLSYQTTHCVRLKTTEHKKNDNLYNIFALYSRQDCDFIRRWLKFFMMMVYPKNFECAGYHCLTVKGLTLDIWSDTIEDGRKGDFLSLYGLNMMLDTHTVVHLSNDRLWTTIQNPPKNYDMLLAMYNFHLVYFRRGLFVELIERKHSLIVVEETADVMTVLIGELPSMKAKH